MASSNPLASTLGSLIAPHLSRRAFLRRSTAASLWIASPLAALPRAQAAIQNNAVLADYTLEISELEWEIAPGKRIHTSAYNGQIPGPLLRLTEGKPVTIDVVNRLTRPEIVHWHGQWIPPSVDGSMEEGTPMIAPGARTRIQFTPRPFGLHWYHTHIHANRDFHLGLYNGQFGFLLVEPSVGASSSARASSRDGWEASPGAYDQEHFLVLHEWDAYFVASDDGSEEVAYRYGTINGRMLGHADPISVRPGQRILLHILNASATLPHWLALPGHQFQIVALDGRPVPTQAKVDTLRLGPAERISALVTMDHPGVWILGETDPKLRDAGLGAVIEYAGSTSKPQWTDPASLSWDYRAFGDATPHIGPKPDIALPLVFTSKFQGHGALNRWMIDGKSFPDQVPITFRQGLRHRLIFNNRSMDDHPIHLHRHAFELASIAGKPTSGVYKDVVIVRAGTVVEANLIPDNPGPTLFHCHQQDHMDLGFMALIHYA